MIRSAPELAEYWAKHIEAGREVGDLGTTMNVAVREILRKRKEERESAGDDA